MPSQQTMLQKLMNTDVSLFLMAGAVLVCVVGYFFGFMVALKTLGGVLIGLFAIGMPLLLMHGDELETEQLEAAQREFGGRLRRHLIPLQGSRSLTFEHQDTVGRLSIHRRSGNSVGSSWLELPGSAGRPSRPNQHHTTERHRPHRSVLRNAGHHHRT